MEKLDFRSMGSAMRAVLAADRPGAQAALAEVPVWFAEWETALSRFQVASELNRLNAAPGKPVPVSKVLWDVLSAAVDAASWTDGLVTPTLLEAVERAGYDRSFELLSTGRFGEIESTAAEKLVAPPAMAFRAPWFRRAPAASSADGGTTPPDPAGASSDWRAISMHPVGRLVTVPHGVRLDLGGIAKGWAADEAVRRLAAFGPALVDAGGDIAVSGPLPGRARWPIAIADPFAPEDHLAMLWLDRGAVATSGRDYRKWRRDGEWRHHIIDPRTGAPAATDVLSATVVARTTRAAEAAAKTALILGTTAGLAWIEAHPPLAALLVCADGQVYSSRRVDAFLGG